MIGMPDLKRAAADVYGAISFATLCTLDLWHSLQRLRTPLVDYYRDRPMDGTFPAAAALTAGVLAAVFVVLKWAVFRALPASFHRPARAVFIGAWLLPALAVIRLASGLDISPATGRALVALAVFLSAASLLLAGFYLVGSKDWPYRLAAGANRLLYPLPVLIAGSLLWGGTPASRFAARVAQAPRPAAADGPRIVWLIFDEFGYGPAFGARPSGLSLPELDRLRAESLFAPNPHTPGSRTLISMPAMIDGEPYQYSLPDRVDELRLTRSDGSSVPWDARKSVFREIRRRGGATVVVGWMHPYCRVLGEELSDCAFVPNETAGELTSRAGYARRAGLLKTSAVLLASELEPLTHSRWAPSQAEMGQPQLLAEFLRIDEARRRVAASPPAGLTLIHYPIPHPWGIYDRRRGAFATGPGVNYLDNLALVDRVVGELRGALERNGSWQKTTLILSTDHPVRDLWTTAEIGVPTPIADRRVPFLIKLAGETAGLEYTAGLNTIVTKELILAIYDGRIRNASEMGAWLASRPASAAPVEAPLIIGE